MISIRDRLASILSSLVLLTLHAESALTNENAVREWEARVQKAVDAVRPAVVAVKAAAEIDGPPDLSATEIFASGVLISDDGLILSQYHVSHQRRMDDATQSAEPGSKIEVILHDGTRHQAIRFGADRVHDVSLLKMVEPGPWPHAPLDTEVTVRPGDDVIKLGYPGGYQAGRPASVRAGRVIQVQDDRFVTDCLVIGGDSGGPFFNLEGRLIGIVQNSAVPPELYVESAKIARRAFFAGVTPNSVIAERLEDMRNNEVLTESAVKPKNVVGTSRMLPGEQWSQGGERINAVRAVTAPFARRVVLVLDGARQVALGTIVGTDGEVLTKASVLPSEPRCRLPSGETLPARVVGADPATDLALLRLSAEISTTIDFDADDDPAVGQWVAAVGTQEPPLGIGIVSMPRRDFGGPFPMQIHSARRVAATLPEIIGSAVDGRGYWVEFVDGDASAAGIMPGDVITTIDGAPVRSHQGLADAVRGRWAGDSVPVEILRAGKPATLSLTLRSRFGESYGGRGDGFATVFECDLPLFENELGAPVLDSAGQVLGMTIARGPVGCLVIPCDRVGQAFSELRSGTLADRWSPTTANADASKSPAGKAVTITVAELRDRLRERQSRFTTLLVDYDLVSEAHIDPLRLVQWGLHNVRDYRERHRVGFLGEKRFTEVTRPAPQPEYVPADQVASDPDAPEYVRQSVDNARRRAVSRKARGDFDYLIAVSREEFQCTLFDGRDCYVANYQGRYVKAPLDNFYAPIMYLANIGLRPIDPAPSPAVLRSQQQFWLPESFDLYAQTQLRPHEEPIDGEACVVLEAEREQEWDGAKHVIRDKIWFDPKLDYALRRWEQNVDDLMSGFRHNSDFIESAPNCWLPRAAIWTRCCPAWTPESFRGRPAYSYRMTLRQGFVAEKAPLHVFEAK